MVSTNKKRPPGVGTPNGQGEHMDIKLTSDVNTSQEVLQVAREKEAYRDLLERLDAAFPKRELLSASDIAKFEGSARETVARRYKFNQHKRLLKVDYARQVLS